jgi:hypothetical protein
VTSVPDVRYVRTSRPNCKAPRFVQDRIIVTRAFGSLAPPEVAQFFCRRPFRSREPPSIENEEEVVMKDAKPYPIPLETEKVQFLEGIAATHGLGDIGKAVRCLINYARDNPDKHRDIFEEIRCLDC